MRLATLRTQQGTRAVKVDGHVLVDLGEADLGAFLALPDWRERAAAADGTGPTYLTEGATYATLVPRPSKVVCVGLNYKSHILEMGRDLPEHPTLFAKFADTLLGPTDPIVRPEETDQLDWEVELAVVVGEEVRRARGRAAEEAIAGFTVLNDVTCRDWQYRTGEWLQGKAWEATTPVGPHLVTPDELHGGVRPEVAITLSVDGEVMQSDTTGDLVFDPVALVEYVSTMVRLHPGDLIATGTPGGVGHARRPARHLRDGETVVAEIEGIGALRNVVIRPHS